LGKDRYSWLQLDTVGYSSQTQIHLDAGRYSWIKIDTVGYS
jgi:hypothetical protein